MEVVRWPHVDIEAASGRKDDQPDDGIDAIRHNGALAEAEVPNLQT